MTDFDKPSKAIFSVHEYPLPEAEAHFLKGKHEHAEELAIDLRMF